MQLKELSKILGRVTLSVLSAGVFYFVWMGVFLLTREFHGRVVRVGLWLAAPIVTGAGFAVGVVIFDRLTRSVGKTYSRVFSWLIVGCAVGASAVWWFGPMLIVFGMFVAGTIIVIVMETARQWRRRP